MENIINRTISPTAKIYDNVYIENSIIEEGAEVLPFSFIKNSTVGRGSIIVSSHIFDSTVGQNCSIGPNAQIRGGSVLDDNTRIGNFVEIKNSKIGSGTKAAHLSYIGDATIGKNCNIGCGVIFCNYDGKNKHPCILEDNIFIGSNSNLIAPLTIGSNSFVAAGSTVTKDIPKNSFVIARVPQNVRPNRNCPQ
ncbi:MAG: hypothetical protein LBN07_04965 [Christensenellaceae bacterium]|jgi:bifunctional UDP-N-acetylglucosamine pyrophosphorylase/glucosamine-1-phosphate N-acetyltransferase|nr:hypothetical protein [Christensenellaceae bacterium]